MPPKNSSGERGENGRAAIYLAIFAMAGLAVILLYRDGYQQDSGYHHLFARWAWRYPEYLVSVWGRPLFTLVYSLPAHFGYSVSRLATLLICLLAGWQSHRLAADLGMRNTRLAVPFLFLQPAFFLIGCTALTEPLFALILAVVIRLHLSGRLAAASLAAGSLILVRPEGFFVGVIYGCYQLWQGGGAGIFRRLAGATAPGCGAALWWAAALWITGDPLWIAHNWPPDWQALGQANGTGPVWWYLAMMPLIVGPFLLPVFVMGLRRMVAGRVFTEGLIIFATILLLHSLMYWQGWFGSAGYPRYFVCLSPMTASITLFGWNLIEEKLVAAGFGPGPAQVLLPLMLASAVFCCFYLDGWKSTRDAFAVDEMAGWLRSRGIEYDRLITSQTYMRIVFDRDPLENPPFAGSRAANLEMIRRAAPLTMVFWDDDTGPKWYQLGPADFAANGFEELRSQSYIIPGYLPWPDWKWFGGPRRQILHLYIKR